MSSPRRAFLKSLSAVSVLSLADLNRSMFAQTGGVKPDARCVNCGGSDSYTPDPNVYTYHNTNMAGPVQSLLYGQATSAQLTQLAVNHIDSWNYSVSHGVDTYVNQAFGSVTTLSEQDGVNLASAYQAYGLSISPSEIVSRLSLSSADASSAISYSKSVGLTAVMNAAYSNIVSESADPLGKNCHPFNEVGNVLALLGFIYSVAGSFAPGALSGVFKAASYGFGILSLGAKAYDRC